MERYARLLDTKTHRNGLRKPTKRVSDAEKLVIDLFFEKKLNCVEACDTYTRFTVTVNHQKYTVTHDHMFGITNCLIITAGTSFGSPRPLIVANGRFASFERGTVAK